MFKMLKMLGFYWLLTSLEVQLIPELVLKSGEVSKDMVSYQPSFLLYLNNIVMAGIFF